jgi:hypothetical protein
MDEVIAVSYFSICSRNNLESSCFDSLMLIQTRRTNERTTKGFFSVHSVSDSVHLYVHTGIYICVCVYVLNDVSYEIVLSKLAVDKSKQLIDPVSMHD